MEKYIPQILALIQQYGVRFIVVLGTVAGLLYLTYLEILDPNLAVGAVVILVVVYLIVSRIRKKRKVEP